MVCISGKDEVADCSECGATSKWGPVRHLGNCDGSAQKREMPPKGPFEGNRQKDCPVCKGAKVVVYKKFGKWRTRKCNWCKGTGKR